MKTLTLASLALASAALATPGSAATVFGDRAAFDAQAMTIVTDRFDAPIATGTSITFDSGITATKSSDGIPPTLNRVTGNTTNTPDGHYDGFVKKDGFRDITFDFGSAIFGFGADILSGLGAGSSLMVMGLFDGMMQTVSVAQVNSGNGFFGLTSSTGFTSVTFRTEAGAALTPGAEPFGGELFSLDNLATSGAAMAAVPLPAAGLPLLIALGALTLGRRKTAKG